MRALAAIMLCALAVPAQAEENNVPRDPIQMEQEKRALGHGFEHKQRRNPQLYPFPAPKQPESRAPARLPAPAPKFEAVTPPGYVGKDG
jgi:hypothetical protein